jgi:outer membrane protein OmpA-like peptidoglycan-associated protein
MTKKIILMLAVACTLQAKAGVLSTNRDSTKVETRYCTKSMTSVRETNSNTVVIGSAWSDNWFVGISGGANAFIGKPLGCEDLFDRIKLTFGLTLGKWFTPSVGGRLYYQGMQFKDCNIAVHDYQHLHADFLWNVLGGRYGKQDNQRLGIIPYVGVGLMHNKDNGQKPFAFSYGVLGQYRLSKRMTASLEIGNTTTFQEFDGYGKVGKFGDNMMSLVAGLSVNIGKVGWKRVGKSTDWDNYHDTYNKVANDNMTCNDNYTRNDYSGLNSLRARLNNKHWDGNAPVQKDSISMSDNNEQTNSNYFSEMQQEKVCIGSPVYFFFELGTANLVTPLQLLNLDEIAHLANEYGLNVTVVGAADSATGSADINKSLGTSRAKYIADELYKRGVASAQVTLVNEGGISDYTPNEANRQTKVMLYSR